MRHHLKFGKNGDSNVPIREFTVRCIRSALSCKSWAPSPGHTTSAQSSGAIRGEEGATSERLKLVLTADLPVKIGHLNQGVLWAMLRAMLSTRLKMCLYDSQVTLRQDNDG